MTTPLERTPEGKWTLYRAIDGQPHVCWPVDGRAFLATGEYTAVPSRGDDRHTAPVTPGSEAAPDVPALPATPPPEHSPGVPLVAATSGTPESPLPSDPETPKAARRRGR